ncbi:MAG: hypothetical protein J2P36_34175, partial [Ktedonobacteraceae bacterium]|nr:hypothetical protein [Ktedonobacteraceae bacterium]
LASLSVLGVEIKSCTVGKVTQISDTKATGSITITAASTKTGETRSEPSSGPMINENGTWKMDEVSDQSLPSQ